MKRAEVGKETPPFLIIRIRIRIITTVAFIY